MNPEPPPLPPQPPKRPITLPLVLAFVPSVLALVAFAGYANDRPGDAFIRLVLAAVGSVACCVISSIMLFKRNTSAAIVFGILLGLLNLFITAGLGCAALLSDFNVH